MLGDTVGDALAHLRKAIDDDEVQIERRRGAARPARSRPVDDDAFGLIESTRSASVFPDAVPAPYVMMAATDSRHFTAHLRPGLPVRAVPDDQGPARGDPLLRRAPRRRRLPRRDRVVPAADREAPRDDDRRRQSTARRARRCHSLVTIVGFLVCVELASGILQGYYTPIYQRHRRPPRRSRTPTSTGSRPRSSIVSALVRAAAGPARRPGRRTRTCCCSPPRSPRSARGSSRSRRASPRS